MMIEPPIDNLVDKAHGRYALVLAVSKRARQLIDGDVPMVESVHKKPITIAIDELFHDKIDVKASKEVD